MLAKTLLSSVIALSATAFAAAAQPVDPEVISVKVSMADLDLGSKAGAAAGLSRIEAASEKACGGQPQTLQLRRQARYRACMKSTVSHAVASLGSPLVTAIYTGQEPGFTQVAKR